MGLVFFCLLGGALLTKAVARRPARPLRIVSYNVRGGMGMDGTRDYERASAVIRAARPDICALQELDSMTRRNGDTDALREFAHRTGLHGTFARAIAYDGGAYGIGLLSKRRPKRVERLPLPGREEARTLIVAEFSDYVVLATHLSLTEADQLASVRLIDSVAASYAGKAVFLAGDLNCQPDSEVFRALRQRFVPLNDTRLPSWPADDPQDTIDYIWGYTGGGISYRVCDNGVIDAPDQSDHRPVFAEVTYGPRQPDKER